MHDFSEALEFKGDYLPAHFGIVVNYMATGMPDKAREALQAAPEETKDSQGNILGSKAEMMESDLMKTGYMKDFLPDNR